MPKKFLTTDGLKHYHDTQVAPNLGGSMYMGYALINVDGTDVSQGTAPNDGFSIWYDTDTIYPWDIICFAPVVVMDMYPNNPTQSSEKSEKFSCPCFTVDFDQESKQTIFKGSCVFDPKVYVSGYSRIKAEIYITINCDNSGIITSIEAKTDGEVAMGAATDSIRIYICGGSIPFYYMQ